MNEVYVLLTAAFIIVLYLFLVRRVAEVMQPFRRRLAERGERLLAEPTLTEGDARVLRYALDHAYSSGMAWRFVWVVPIAGFLLLVRRLRGKPAPSGPTSGGALRGQLIEVTNRATLSTLSNSPLAALIVFIEIVIGVILMVPLRPLLDEIQSLLTHDDNHHHHNGHNGPAAKLA